MDDFGAIISKNGEYPRYPGKLMILDIYTNGTPAGHNTKYILQIIVKNSWPVLRQYVFFIFPDSIEPKVMKITGVPGITERINNWGPFDLPAAHVFKIRNGMIYEIEAIGYVAEHGIKNGWE